MIRYSLPGCALPAPGRSTARPTSKTAAKRTLDGVPRRPPPAWATTRLPRRRDPLEQACELQHSEPAAEVFRSHMCRLSFPQGLPRRSSERAGNRTIPRTDASPAGSGARRREAEHHALRRQLLERRAEESSLREPVDHLGLAGTQVSVRERRLLRKGSRELAAEKAFEVPALEVHGECLRRLALTAGDRREQRDDRLDLGQELERVEGELDRLAAQQHQALRRRLAGERAVLFAGEAAEAEERRLAGLDDRDVALGELPVTSVAERDVLEGEAGDLAGLRRDGHELLAVRAAVLASDLGRDLACPLETALLGGEPAGGGGGGAGVAAAHEADRQQRGEDHHDDHRIPDHEPPAVNGRTALEARQRLLRFGCLLA